MIYTPGHNKHDLEHSIKEMRPTYAYQFSWAKQDILDWAQSEYVMVVYKGVPVNFLDGSGDVRWDDIEAAREAGEVTLATPEW